MGELSKKSRKIPKNMVEDEVDDLADRLNSVELELIEAKEFSHLSSEAFEMLQSQINELRGLMEGIFTPSPEIGAEPSQKFALEYF